MVPMEEFQKPSRRINVFVQLIFNAIVALTLVIICLSLVFKFHAVDEKLEEVRTLSHTVHKRAVTNLESCTVQCPRGPRGPPGPEGTKAIPGVPGVPGVPGNNGEPGTKGDKGDPGEIGVSGVHCSKGESGRKGDKGDQGEIGIPGERGTQGPRGKKGETGLPGERGVKGSRGKKGESGLGILWSCDAIKKAGVNYNGTFLIDPDGLYGLEPFLVSCDMTSDVTLGYTVIHHDKEDEGVVNGYEEAGSFRVNVTYDLEMRQIKAITNVSATCRQFIKYECTGSAFELPSTNRNTFWVSVDDKMMFNWGGVPTGTIGCECGLTRSCADTSDSCNCDKNDESHTRVDEGYLNDKATLPVTQLRFGDTGSHTEKGIYTLGPLQCV